MPYGMSAVIRLFIYRWPLYPYAKFLTVRIVSLPDTAIAVLEAYHSISRIQLLPSESESSISP